MIPVRACGCKTWVSAARQFIVFTLDDEFRLRKGIVIARVVHVEMGADQKVDIVRVQPKSGKMLKHIFLVPGRRRSRRWRVTGRESTIDENVLPITRLDKIAPRRRRRRLRSRRDGRGPQLHKVESLRSCAALCHLSVLPLEMGPGLKYKAEGARKNRPKGRCAERQYVVMLRCKESQIFLRAFHYCD